MSKNRNTIRLWPAIAVLILDGMVVSWIWIFLNTIRQQKVVFTIFTQVIAVLFLAIWLLFLSGLKWKSRLLTFASGVVVLTTFFWLFPVQNMSGDLVPKLGWRWSSKPNAEDSGVFQIEQPLNNDSMALISELSYTQFRGPERDGIISGVKLNTDWQTHPPKLIWKQPIGKGWSGFSVLGNRALTQEQRENEELVVCYELLSGQMLWKHSDKARFDANFLIGGIGPRATPTINNDRVYALGATGILNCLNLTDGTLLWQRNILADANASIKEWGMTGSPLVIDNQVIVSAGGNSNQSLLSYEKLTGEKLWASGTDHAGYSSPQFVTIAGIPQVLIFNWEHLVSHDPTSGQILWKFPWTGDTQRVAQPVVLSGDRVFITTGYGVGSKLIKIRKDEQGQLSPTLMWSSNRMKAKFANVIPYGEFIYGLDDGILACLDLQDGKRRWKGGRYGHGQMLLVGDLLLITTEDGEVVLVKPNPDELTEVARFSAIDGKTWNNPTLAGPYLLVRNSEEAACYELPILN